MSAAGKTVDAAYGEPVAERRRWWWARLASLARFAFAAILIQTPVTAVFVLGWLMRMMHREEAFARARFSTGNFDQARPGLPYWIVGEGLVRGWISRLFGSAIENLRLGMAAAFTLFVGTAPFTVLWLLSWWGGWENSFNKGYEQSWVGPVVGLVGTAIALPLLAYQPMALAHQAARGTIRAYFDVVTVVRLIRAVAWRYVGLSLFIATAALLVLIAKAAPVFIEQWRPGFAERDAEAVQEFARSYRFWMSAGILALLLMARRASARLHARAMVALSQSGSGKTWFGWVVGLTQVAFLMAIWFSLVAQVYIGQFFNHHWSGWMNVPLLGLPWLP